MLRKGFVALVCATLLALGLGLGTRALAIGIGIAPTSFELRDALRGEEYFYSFLILNPGDQEAVFLLSTEGTAASWITFYLDPALPRPVDAVVVPGGGRVQLAVRLAIPLEAADGQHAASIVVESVQRAAVPTSPAQDNQRGAAVVMRVRADVSIHVTGTKQPSAEAPTPTAPEQSTAAPPASQEAYVEHVVRRGENLTRIARQYGVSVEAIAEANNIRNPSLIYIGQKLRIPLGGQAASTATPEAATTPTPTGTRPPEPTPTSTPLSTMAPATPQPEGTAPAAGPTPAVVTAEQMQAAMQMLWQGAGCTPQVALAGGAIGGMVMMRRRRTG
jgi:LysM repeat protein